VVLVLYPRIFFALFAEQVASFTSCGLSLTKIGWPLKPVSFETSFNGQPIFVNERPQEVKEATCSANKAKKILGYKTKTTLKESIKLTTEFIKKRGTKPFIYNLPVEIVNEITPKTWTKKTI
jgi:UDP-glucose 4-epimerase